MKKQLLLGSALLAAISAFPQQRGRVYNPALEMTPAKKAAQMNKTFEGTGQNTPVSSTVLSKTPKKSQPANRTSAQVATWVSLTGSANPYGVLVSTQKPLQYNETLNAVSFIDRKSNTYQANPTPPVNLASGVIVAMISSNGGTSWDSTCVWNHPVQTGRYPQGLIYNPSGNTNISGAYVLATGPALPYNPAASGNWGGDFFASKPLSAFTNSAGADQQFVANIPPYGALGKVDFARYEMTATASGKVYLAANLVNDVNSASTSSDYRGFSVIQGTLNSSTGGFDWSVWDTLSFNNPAAAHSFSAELDNSGNPNLYVDPHMCWNEAGTVAYFWTIGTRAGNVVGTNSSFQPLVWKYDANATPMWSYLPQIDFTLPEFKTVLSHIDSANGGSNRYPTFAGSEEWDGIVDANNNLHIFSALYGSNDSIQGHQGYDDGGEIYNWNHYVPGLKPYLWDFTYTGSSGHPWKAMLIDSLDTEAPGSSGNPGYDSNPWTEDAGSKPAISARLQMSRTTDGQYILYTWSDSNPEITGSKFWNTIPSLKVRAYSVASNSLFPQLWNVTEGNTNIDQQAYFHYTSPKCAKIASGTNSVNIMLPMTATTNSFTPGGNGSITHISNGTSVTHYYTSANLCFNMLGTLSACTITDGISNQSINTLNSEIYPNPAKNNAVLSVSLNSNSKVNVTVLNIVGQQVKAASVYGQAGENKINLDLNGLSAGVYLVNIKAGNAVGTKKLIIE